MSTEGTVSYIFTVSQGVIQTSEIVSFFRVCPERWCSTWPKSWACHPRGSTFLCAGTEGGGRVKDASILSLKQVLG
jgi:hypothetical protein